MPSTRKPTQKGSKKTRSTKDGNNSNKKKGKTKKKRRVLLFTVLLILLAILMISLFVVFDFYKSYKVGGVSKNTYSLSTTEIEIKSGSSLTDIANLLQKYGILENANAFLLKCKVENLGLNIPAGNFNISSGFTFYELIETLQSPIIINNGTRLLIKEGATQEDIAKNLDNMGIVSYDDFMTTANTGNFDYHFINEMPTSSERESRLEGYLYPDTYFLSEDETSYSIINKLLRRFNELYTVELQEKAKKLNLTTDEVITMASIIEKEISYPPERSIASSVIFNRLEQGMKLQMDATVLYAKKEHSDRTTIADTQIESGYNTYFVEGLPIGPISNPSIACIEAVLNPDDTNYLYYVVENDETGQHFYTASYNEFLKAKEKYIQKFD